MKPILFSTPMVKAILDGRKTMTRRVAKMPENTYRVERNDDGTFDAVWGAYMPQINGFVDGSIEVKPKYVEGDVLWVRETWLKADDGYYYKADIKVPSESEDMRKAYGYKWKPSIHMPKEAARIFLRVTGVRVERLQDIDEYDGQREGFEYYGEIDFSIGETYTQVFKRLWNSTIKPADLDTYGWDANPWVWVYEFERCGKPGGTE